MTTLRTIKPTNGLETLVCPVIKTWEACFDDPHSLRNHCDAKITKRSPFRLSADQARQLSSSFYHSLTQVVAVATNRSKDLRGCVTSHGSRR